MNPALDGANVFPFTQLTEVPVAGMLPGTTCSGTLLKTRAQNWSEEETQALLNAFFDQSLVLELCSSNRKKPVYEAISSSLATKNVCRSADQCRVRMKNLKNEYKQFVQNMHNGIEGSQRNVKYFEQLERIFGGGYFANYCAVLVKQEGEESGDAASPPMPFVCTAASDSTNVQPQEDHLAHQLCASQQLLYDTAVADGPSTRPRAVKRKHDAEGAGTTTAPPGLADSVPGLLQAVLSVHRELEEKRMRMQHETELRRIQYEQERRREERAHELQLVALITQALAPKNVTPPPPLSSSTFCADGSCKGDVRGL